ncbi:MAG: histidine kinase [Lachnospiraceae bacterium]|nr:histidine kinase [Lachnospiraceae bacterium]
MKKIIRTIKAHLILRIACMTSITIIVPGLIAVLLTYTINFHTAQEQIIASNTEIVSLVSRELENVILEIVNPALSIYSYDSIVTCLRNPDPYTWREYSELQNFLEEKLTQSMSICGIAIVGANGNYVKRYNDGNDIDSSRMNQFESFEEGFQIIYDDKGAFLFGVYRKTLYDYPADNILANCYVYFYDSGFEKVAGNLDREEQKCPIWILDKEKEILFEQGLTDIVPAVKSDEIFCEGIMDGKRGYYFSVPVKISGEGVSLHKFVFRDIVVRTALSTVIPVLIIQIVLFIFAIIFLYALSKYIIFPIQNIAKNLGKIEEGIYKYQAVSRSLDEIGQLDREYEKMVSTVNNLINNEMKSKIEMAEARFRMLQAQINPHFLNNILQVIGTQALCQGADDVNEMLFCLSTVCRYNMNLEQNEVELQDEIEHIANYLDLVKIRYGELIEYQLSCEEICKKQRMPKMILQPLVENSIKYGKVKQRCSVQITIRSMKQDNNVIIMVEDNGLGMTRERMADLQYAYEQNQFSLAEGSSIGLLNVLQRMKMYYGDAFKWEIACESGCKIILRMPDKRAE